MSKDRKVAIVTGAAKGIGAAIARRFGAGGFAVIVNYATSADEAARVALDIEQAGGKAVAAQGDVGIAEDVGHLFDLAEQQFDGVDVVVSNAGFMKLGPIAEIDDATYQRHLSANLTGTFNVMREAARRVRDDGRIISISSSVIGYYLPNYSVYAATKAAVEAMTHVVAKELGSRRITVNAIAPGPVGTELFLAGKPQSLLDAIVKDIPLGRLGKPDDIAEVAAFLAGPDSGWINGQVLRANGGRN